MNYESMKDVPQNMKRTGMLLFRSALYESLRKDIPMCVVHVAHAAEILLKARIAQEHPLLIFSKLPKTNNSLEKLSLINLLEKGRTFSYDELPDQLWATTGLKIPPDQLKQYREFGQLRNQIIHFAMFSQEELGSLAVKYCLDFLDPLVERFWGKSVIDYIHYDPGKMDVHGETELSNGSLEKLIRDFLPINKRLRKLLGEESLKAYENNFKQEKRLMEEYREYEEWENQQPDNYWQERYDQHIEFELSKNPNHLEEQKELSKRIQEFERIWKELLNSD